MKSQIKKPKVSVIIPVYNAEPYIARCARSLFSQTLDNIEYIFIDDCSEDASIKCMLEVLDAFPERLPFIKVIRNRSNIGVGQSRQIGIDAASGEYIIHCDADDRADADMYQSMYESAVSNRADIVVCGYRVESESGSTPMVQLPDSDKRIMFHQIASESLHTSLCLKLISASLAKSVNIEPGINHWEDFSITPLLMLMAKKIVTLDRCPYHYYIENAKSITRINSRLNAISAINAASSLTRRIEEHGLASDIDAADIYRIQWSAKKNLIFNPSKANIKLWRTTFAEANSHYKEIGLTPKLKLLTWLAIHNHHGLLKIYSRLKFLF